MHVSSREEACDVVETLQVARVCLVHMSHAKTLPLQWQNLLRKILSQCLHVFTQIIEVGS